MFSFDFIVSFRLFILPPYNNLFFFPLTFFLFAPTFFPSIHTIFTKQQPDKGPYEDGSWLVRWIIHEQRTTARTRTATRRGTIGFNNFKTTAWRSNSVSISYLVICTVHETPFVTRRRWWSWFSERDVRKIATTTGDGNHRCGPSSEPCLVRSVSCDWEFADAFLTKESDASVVDEVRGQLRIVRTVVKFSSSVVLLTTPSAVPVVLAVVFTVRNVWSILWQ